MKKTSLLLITLMVLSACGTESRKSEPAANQTPPTQGPDVQAENRPVPTPPEKGMPNLLIDQEIENLTAQYAGAEIVLKIKTVKDRISVYYGDEVLKIDREKSSYFVRIIALTQAEPKLIIDRFYENGEHLSKEITLKKTASEADEVVYESNDDLNEKVEERDGYLVKVRTAPSCRVSYKDGKWSVRYREIESKTLTKIDKNRKSLALANELFGKVLALNEVKEALPEDTEPKDIHKIKLYFSVYAKGMAEKPDQQPDQQIDKQPE